MRAPVPSMHDFGCPIANRTAKLRLTVSRRIVGHSYKARMPLLWRLGPSSYGRGGRDPTVTAATAQAVNIHESTPNQHQKWPSAFLN